MAEDTGTGQSHPVGADIRTFLFADMRGYTQFTQEHGDEAASAVAGRFADLVRDAAPEFEGELLELRGDEALCVFRSARQALRASVELQRRLRTAMEDEPAFPLGVGMGLDAGEAVPTQGGYRGASLNLAARLCASAKPGEILATEGVAHLAHRVEGLRLVGGRSARLKGIAQPVRFVVVAPEAPLPTPPAAPAVPGWRPTRVWALSSAGGAAVLVVLALFVLGRSAPRGVAVARADTVAIVDPSSGDVRAQTPIGPAPVAIAVGFGSTWVVNRTADSVARVALDGRVIDPSITVGHTPSAIAFGDGAVWVANSGDGTVTRIDGSGRPGPPIVVGNSPGGIAAGPGGVWVTSPADDTIVQIDPATDRVVGRVAVGADPTSVTIAAGSVWVTNRAGNTVSRIDPTRHDPPVPISVGQGPDAVASAADGVWVANGLDGTIQRIHAARGVADPPIRVGGRPVGLAVTDGFVWVADANSGLERLDTATGRLRTVIAGGDATGVAAGGGGVWVTSGDPPGTHRGGTLVVVSKGTPDSIDPALSYDSNTWGFLAATNDGLVSYKRVGGAESQAVVPDLAVALPTIGNGGRTYTFQLRPGIRYSTGGELTPKDVRYTFERIFEAASPGNNFYLAIRGALACWPLSQPRPNPRCDLSRGITTNDVQRTVTFHLVHPDPAFIEKLAMTFADIVPEGTPIPKPGSTIPVPATGPYSISGYRTGQHPQLVGVRNRRFHEWSVDAQPAGYPDTIHWQMGVSASVQVHDIEHGTADVMIEDIPSTLATSVATRFPEQVKVDRRAETWGMFLNTRLPPFNNPKARRAVNYATDRPALAGPISGGEPTCQILPPDFPGYQPYCPFGPTPDLGEARRLVSASGTRGMRVTVFNADLPTIRAFGPYFVNLLDSLGYHASLRTPPYNNQYLPEVLAAPNAIQIGFFGWVADYPAASDFLNVLFACQPTDPHLSYNDAEFCDPGIARMTKQALGLDATNPGEANLLWARIDHRITNAAAWVPLLNPATVRFVSHRVGNYEYSSPLYGPLIDQLWIK